MAAASDYAGAAACQTCHAAEIAAQSQSAHASSLAPSSPSQPGEWAFGAGTQAMTFVKRQDADNYMELGETWYRQINGFALTPGHHNKDGVRYRIFDPSAAILRCFSCHSTGPVTLDATEAIIPHELGVRCEACHGPAAAHASDPVGSPMRDPTRLTPDEVNGLCGQCHRMPAIAGDATDLHNPWNARHQPLMLAASECFRRSGKLSCVTCHSPHAALVRSLVTYDHICQNCHPGVAHKEAISRKACASCHMPRARPLQNLSFANHRIAVYSPNDAMSPIARRH